MYWFVTGFIKSQGSIHIDQNLTMITPQYNFIQHIINTTVLRSKEYTFAVEQ